jgi:hypothetical protein
LRSRDGVASAGRIEESEIPVCQARIGNPFQMSKLLATSPIADIVSTSSVICSTHGFLLRLTPSDTTVTATIAMVAKQVPTNTNFSKASSKAISFPNTLATSRTLCFGDFKKASRMLLTLFIFSSGTSTDIVSVSMIKHKYSFLWAKLSNLLDFLTATTNPAFVKVAIISL